MLLEKTGLNLLFFVLILSASTVTAQKTFTNYAFDSSTTYVMKLLDRTEYIGKFLQKDSISVVIITNSASKVEIPFNKIKSIEVVKNTNLKKGVYWFPNPNATRYFFGPSAFSLKKGEGYYQNSYLVLNSVNVGITNNLSVGGGLELISTVTGHPIFFITPKVGLKVTDKFHTAVGVLYANMPTFDSNGDSRTGLGILYALGTYGTTEKNLTGGVGWGYIENEFSAKPVITINGMTRISRRLALLSENYLIPTGKYYGVFSYGIRFFGEKISVDLGFINNPDILNTFLIGIPYVDFVVKFN